MDYFKSAASAFLAKGGPLPNYSMGERDAWFEGRTIWSLFTATRRDDGSACSVLVFDALQPAHNPRRSLLPLAKNALRRFRTVRHPDVVKLIDSAETPTAIYIVIESVRPLGKVLEAMKGSRHQREEWVCWGLSKIANAVRFINTDMSATHGNLRADSIFLAASGEWRLGGLELVSSSQEEAPVLYNMGSLVPDAARYAPPELKQQGWSVARDLTPASSDSWSFALIIVEGYNGSLPPGIIGVPTQGRIPETQYKLVKRLMLPNAKARLSTAAFLEAGQAPGGFFVENRLVKVASGLDSFLLAREDERADIIRQIKTSAQSFPPDFLQYKVLPALISAIGFSSPPSAAAGTSNAPAGRILPLILQLGAPLSESDWSSSIAPTVLKAFASSDRSIRMTLLETLPEFSARFDTRTISDKVWPNLLSGFGDSAPAIREATVRSILPLADKLSDRILNNDLLRQLARTQVDNEPSIRTNTTILLGNLAPKLTAQTHKKVLVPAFVRSLRDPFVHARTAGIMAFLATSATFDGEDSAKQILPALCPCLIDDEKVVRDQAKTAVACFLAKAEATAADMKDAATAVDNSHGVDAPSKREVPSTAAGAARFLSRYTESTRSDTSRAIHSTLVDEEATGSASQSRPSAESAPSWAQSGDLIDVMDDYDDWTSFEVGKSNGTSHNKKPARAIERSNGMQRIGTGSSTSRAPRMATTGSLQRALEKSTLAVATGSADDEAWEESAASDANVIQRMETNLAPATHAHLATARQQAPSPGAAFAAKAPWDASSRSSTPLSTQANDVRSAEEAGGWAPIDDRDSGDETKPAQSVPVAVMSKQEKRLEMERKREERRLRMAQLKQNKASKLAAGLE